MLVPVVVVVFRCDGELRGVVKPMFMVAMVMVSWVGIQ